MAMTSIRHLITAALRTPTPLRRLSSGPPPTTRTRTPLETHFESWVQTLKPGFTPAQVDQALRSQPDPDLALDIFRWTANRRSYAHTPETYLTMLRILTGARHHRHAETLIDEILSGACGPTVPLYNAVVRFCCSRSLLFNRAFDAYKKMSSSDHSKPDLETFTLLLSALLRRFDNPTACHVYLRAVRSLSRQMKALGVVPDTFVLNMIVKAFARCRHVDEAIRVFREMGLYGCEPNSHTYGYIAKGLCEKGRVKQGFGFYSEMRGKGLVPSGSVFMALICGLAMEGRVGEAVAAVFDMLGCSMSPDLLTYKTVLDEMCRAGKGDEAAELLEEFRRRDGSMGLRTYKALLNALHFVGRD